MNQIVARFNTRNGSLLALGAMGMLVVPAGLLVRNFGLNHAATLILALYIGSKVFIAGLVIGLATRHSSKLRSICSLRAHSSLVMVSDSESSPPCEVPGLALALSASRVPE